MAGSVTVSDSSVISSEVTFNAVDERWEPD